MYLIRLKFGAFPAPLTSSAHLCIKKITKQTTRRCLKHKPQPLSLFTAPPAGARVDKTPLHALQLIYPLTYLFLLAIISFFLFFFIYIYFIQIYNPKFRNLIYMEKGCFFLTFKSDYYLPLLPPFPTSPPATFTILERIQSPFLFLFFFFNNRKL